MPSGIIDCATAPCRLFRLLGSRRGPTSGLANSPTSWYWNIRIGDKLRFGDVGPLYTVVGPMTTYTSELFVNCGTPGVDFPGTKSPLIRFADGSLVEVEFLFLVNGKDDDGNGSQKREIGSRLCLVPG